MTHYYEVDVDRSFVSNFVDSFRLANLTSHLKMGLKPVVLGFHYKKEGREVRIYFAERGRKRKAVFSTRSKSKDIPWDLVEKNYKEINSVAIPLIDMLGVKTAHA